MPDKNDRKNRNIEATAYMTAASVSFSFVPALIGNAATASPMIFGALWRTGLISVLLLYIFLRHRHVMESASIRAISRKLTSPYLIATFIGQFDYVMVAIANKHMNIAVVSSVFNTYTLLSVCITAFLFRGQQRYRPISGATIPLYLIGLVGVGLTILSQDGRIEFAVDSQGVTGTAIFITLAAPILSSGAAGAMKWGTELSKSLQSSTLNQNEVANHELGYVLLATTIGSLVTIPINCMLAVATGSIYATTRETVVMAIIGGLILNPIALVPWRKANIITTNLGVNAISYCTPLLTLIWLFLLQRASVARMDYLIIGTITIAGTNLLINTERSVNPKFTITATLVWTAAISAYVALS